MALHHGIPRRLVRTRRQHGNGKDLESRPFYKSIGEAFANGMRNYGPSLGIAARPVAELREGCMQSGTYVSLQRTSLASRKRR
jgi:hypothetical protein